MTRSRALTILIVLLALALGTVVTDRLPSYGDVVSAPIVRSAARNEPVTLRTGTYTVTGVDAAPKLTFAYGNPRVTTGTFAVLDVTVLARGKQGGFASGSARLVTTDGREFSALSGQPVCFPAQPGLPIACRVAFETDPKALGGAHLMLPAQDVGDLSPVVLERADIDLLISDADAAALAAKTAPIKLVAAEQRGTR